MSDASPWDEIAVPKSDLTVRQIGGVMSVPCFWGRDVHGACLFIMELAGDHTSQFRKGMVAVTGIGIDLRAGEAGSQRLVLTLERQTDRDLFESLCRTLIAALATVSDPASSLGVALAHLKRWKAFLAGRGNARLSAEEIRGLFAELTFLMELIGPIQSADSALEAWKGPERSHQDFIFRDRAVEIKSLSGSERSTVRISSEDQLESINDALFLRLYRLSEIPDAPRARSLNQLVRDIHGGLDSAAAIEAFDRKLALQGYAPLVEYDEPKFVVSEVSSYEVNEGFPSLVRSQLPTGIAKVAYDIQLEAIRDFICDAGAVFGGSSGTDN